MKNVAKLLLLTCLVGLIGWRVIRALSGGTLKYLRKLMGDEWVEREMLCAEPRHSLGKWYKKSANNPITRYTEELIDFILNSRSIKCDAGRLATKVSGEFVDTLVEMGYGVFLGKQGFHVTMEPSAPQAGPDLLAVRGSEYFIEIKKVGLDEAQAKVDLATEDVFSRLRATSSRHSVLVSMTDDYSAFSQKLVKALKVVRDVLKDLDRRQVQRATLYYHGPEDYELHEGEEREPDFDYQDGDRLAVQMREFERRRNARFIARFDDTGRMNPHTGVWVHPLGRDPHFVKPDETYLRLRAILRKKRHQLPKASRGVILLELSDLVGLRVSEETVKSALYGQLMMTVSHTAGHEGFDTDWNRKPNGFFLGTSRVSAVVIEAARICGDDYVVRREVFPTNNPQAIVLTLDELRSFGAVAEDLEHLCAERL